MAKRVSGVPRILRLEVPGAGCNGYRLSSGTDRLDTVRLAEAAMPTTQLRGSTQRLLRKEGQRRNRVGLAGLRHG